VEGSHCFGEGTTVQFQFQKLVVEHNIVEKHTCDLLVVGKVSVKLDSDAFEQSEIDPQGIFRAKGDTHSSCEGSIAVRVNGCFQFLNSQS